MAMSVACQPSSDPSSDVALADAPSDGSYDASGGPDAGDVPVDAASDGDAAADAPAPADAPPPVSHVTVPIEVLGPAHTRVEVHVEVADPTGITHLYLQCHACGYGDRVLDTDEGRTKAAVSINGGAPIALEHYTGDGGIHGNPALRVLEPEASYGGIGGGFRTVRFTVPIGGLVSGDNVFTFEHVDPDDLSIGYRIVDLDLLRGDDLAARALPPGTVQLDDPSAWEPPLTSDADRAAGAAAWARRRSLRDPAFDALDGPGDGSIVASCADCHAADGRDLHYFNYSNASIVERARFHGLSGDVPLQIASYVRRLAVPAPAGARPYNPPYQPGPGTDARGEVAWAAGAGLGAVLDSDAALRDFLFPRGTDRSGVAAVVSRLSTLDMRELPIAVQLPDWNRWLPRVHPIDAFDTSSVVVTSDERGIVGPGPFFDRLYDQTVADPTNESIDALSERLQRWMERGADCWTQTATNGPSIRSVNGLVMRALSIPGAPSLPASGTDCTTPLTAGAPEWRHDPEVVWAVEIARRSLISWLSIKQWELVQAHALETESRGRALLTVGSAVIDPSEALGWGLSSPNVFRRAAHFSSFDSRRFSEEDPLVSTYGNSVWYHLQLVMNPGYRTSMPSHFPYSLNWNHNLGVASGRFEPFRFFATYIKMRQLQTSGTYGDEVGLDLRTAQPFQMVCEGDGDDRSRAVGGELQGLLVELLLTDLLDDAAHATRSDWDAARQNSVVQLAGPVLPWEECEDLFVDFGRPLPRSHPARTACALRYQDPGRFQGNNTYRVIPSLHALGVDPAVIGRLIDWSTDDMGWTVDHYTDTAGTRHDYPSWDALRTP